MYNYNVDWESYEYTVKDIDVYNDCTYDEYYGLNENNENSENDENNENSENDENKFYENNRKRIIEEITREIIGSYVEYIVHDDNKSNSNYHKDCPESCSEERDDIDDNNSDREEGDDVDDSEDEDVKSLDSDSDEDVKSLDSDEDNNSDSEEGDNSEEIHEKNTKILINCCTLYIAMLSIYVNTILCTYIALRC